MASNRGPQAVQPPPASAYSRENQEYYKARDTTPSYQWAQNRNNPTSASSGGVGGSWASASATPSGHIVASQQHSHSSTPSIHITPSGAPPPATGGTAVSDGSYERNLVMELCPPGGMKAVPPPDKLASFTRVVPSLNSDLVCPVLLDCLEEGQPWIIRAKALCVMETCIQSGGRHDGSNPYRDFFYACSEEIVPLISHSRAAIRDPAKRVLALMGVELSGGYEATPAPSAAATPPPNLLDFDDDTPAPASAPPPPPSEAPPPPPGAAASSSSLFGGMQVKHSNATGVSSTVADAVAPAPTSGNLLDDFAPQPAAAAPNPPGTTGTPGSDIFRDVAVKQNGVGSTASMFDQMNLKGDTSEDKKTDSEDAGDVTSLSQNGSAFGFINESNSKESGAGNEPGTVEHHPPAAPESFDPLKNFSPNTAQKKMMQLSPEQMQAMAYQQMMMQQQMQQMQRAYAMGKMQPGMPMPPQAFMMGAPGMANPNMAGFSFKQDSRPVKKDDKKFDFVKDAMQNAK